MEAVEFRVEIRTPVLLDVFIKSFLVPLNCLSTTNVQRFPSLGDDHDFRGTIIAIEDEAYVRAMFVLDDYSRCNVL